MATISREVRFAPAYGVNEVARYLRIPRSTLRWWISGRSYGSDRPDLQPVIKTPEIDDAQQLSFVNVVEAHILAALRRQHGLPLQQIRSALGYLMRSFPENVDHPLAFRSFSTDGKYLFLDHLGKLINLSREGQYEIRDVIEIYLRRIDYDDQGPLILYPFISDPFTREDKPRVVMISPYISFGRPVLAGRGVSTEVIYERFNAGERIVDLARDYGRKSREIEEAIRYESATQAAA